MSDLRGISDGLDLEPIETRLENYPKGEVRFRTYYKEGNENWHNLTLTETEGKWEKVESILIDGNNVISYWADYADDSGLDINPAVASLIANATMDITALLAEIKRLQDVEEELRDRIAQMEYTCDH